MTSDWMTDKGSGVISQKVKHLEGSEKTRVETLESRTCLKGVFHCAENRD